MGKKFDIRIYHERQRADDAIKSLTRLKGRLNDVCSLVNDESYQNILDGMFY